MVKFNSTTPFPQILGLGTATQPNFFTQHDILSLYQINDSRIKSIFLNGAIHRRSLCLPLENFNSVKKETQSELLKKHSNCGIEMGARALETCLEKISAHRKDVEYLCCITSTGLLTPGFSALLCKQLNLERNCGRLDIVGMGCNAGLNGLNAVANWVRVNPGRLAIMLCIEVCSAAYVFDGTLQTAVVNSLFGDGAAAVALAAGKKAIQGMPSLSIIKFSSYIITEALNAMKFNWDDNHGKFSFFLDPQVPYVIGAHAERVINQLLEGTQLRRSDINHWIIHSGGKKVIDSIKVNLGLSRYDLRHTVSVLRDYGNLSSGSFLFCLKRLIQEGKVKSGDMGILMTMGPGSTIETALIKW